jgi:hypothetical protein
MTQVPLEPAATENRRETVEGLNRQISCLLREGLPGTFREKPGTTVRRHVGPASRGNRYAPGKGGQLPWRRAAQGNDGAGRTPGQDRGGWPARGNRGHHPGTARR